MRLSQLSLLYRRTSSWIADPRVHACTAATISSSADACTEGGRHKGVFQWRRANPKQWLQRMNGCADSSAQDALIVAGICQVTRGPHNVKLVGSTHTSASPNVGVSVAAADGASLADVSDASSIRRPTAAALVSTRRPPSVLSASLCVWLTGLGERLPAKLTVHARRKKGKSACLARRVVAGSIPVGVSASREDADPS